MAQKSVVDYLAELPQETLAAMLETARRELARLTVEADQLEEALARKQRRGRTGGAITKDQVMKAAQRAFSPFTAADIQRALAEEGYEVTVNAIRNHLNRLVDRGQLARAEDGYVVSVPLTPAAPDDDVPF